MRLRSFPSPPPFVRRPVLLLGCLALSLVPLRGSIARGDAGSLDPRSVEEEARRVLRQGSASVSIALVANGEVVWARAWGYANVRAGLEATPETVYNVGSTLKAITATAAMQLVDEGRLELDAPIRAALGDLPPPEGEWPAPTLRQLLTHTSGIEESTEFLEVWDPAQPVPTLEALARASRQVRPPGSRYEYSNLGFALVGLLIERARGEAYGPLVAHRILEPLGIRRSSMVGLEPGVLERLALPYEPDPAGGPRPVPQMRTAVFPAGDAYLSPSEYARFLLAHLGDGELDGQRILSAAAARQMRSPQLPHYGLGWGLSPGSGHALIGHGGRVPGYSAFVLGDPADGTGVVAFANSGELSRLVRAGLAALHGEPYVPPERRASIALAPDLLDGYVGCYEVQPGVVLEILRRDDRLVALAPEAQELELRAESRDHFFLAPMDARLTFVRDRRGAVDQMVLDPGPVARRLARCPSHDSGDPR